MQGIVDSRTTEADCLHLKGQGVQERVDFQTLWQEEIYITD